jgi:hypothetical protein
VLPTPTQTSTRSTPASSAHLGSKRARETIAPQPQYLQHPSHTGSESEEQSEEDEPPLTVGDITRATASCVWTLRMADESKWYPPQRELLAGPFWTSTQRLFHRALFHGRFQFYDHRQLRMDRLARAVPTNVDTLEAHFSYMPGLLNIFTLPGYYIEDWAEIFYSTVWIP